VELVGWPGWCVHGYVGVGVGVGVVFVFVLVFWHRKEKVTRGWLFHFPIDGQSSRSCY
jgi:hypothetical protein